MIATGHTLQLGHARIAGAGASRSLLSEGLAQVPLARLGLGEEELLVIPRLLSRAVLRSGADGRVEPCFGRSLGAELTAALAAAAIDPLPGTRATAYRFTTRLSFARWLLGHWARGGGSGQGRAGQGLYSEVAGVSALQWARSHLFDDGRSLPGVFAALARQGLAATVLARLDPADVARLRVALARSHGLPLPAWPVTRQAGTGNTGAEASMPALVALAASTRAAGNDLAALPAAAVELLLVLLHLESEPSAPRMALAAAAATIAAAPSAGSTPSGGSFTSAATVGSDASLAPVGSGLASRPEAADSTAPTTLSTANPSGTATTAPPEPRPAPPSPIPPAPSRRESTGVSPSSPPAIMAPPATATAPANATEGTTTATSAFASDFAGLWFLCNAFLALGLYGDFSRPSEGLLALAPSRLLDQLALQWFGSPYRDDRLHTALARDGVDPSLPERWQVTPAWLEPFTAEEGRLRVNSRHHQTLWHPAGFPLRDTPLPRRKDRRNPRRSTGRRGRPSGAVRPVPQLPSAQSARWLACLALYLDARIQRATGDPALGLSSLALPGHCRISAERVDVGLALADLPLPLRLAGLDRDPGWLPAEGRTIAFHFD